MSEKNFIGDEINVCMYVNALFAGFGNNLFPEESELECREREYARCNSGIKETDGF